MSLHNGSQSQTALYEMPFQLGQTGVPFSKPVDMRHALDEIRKMKEFQPPESNPFEKWLEQPWIKKLGEQMSQALSHALQELAKGLKNVHLPGTAHLPQNIREIFSGFVWVLILLIGLLALYILLGVFLRWTEQKYSMVKPVPRIFEETLLINAEHHRGLAKEYAGQGRYTEGIRQWYLALLCLLDETKLAPFSNTRSNREYSVLFTEKAIQTPFNHLAQQFENIRYGKNEGQAAQFNQCENWYDQLTQEIQAHA
jgi:hypothetical protein